MTRPHAHLWWLRAIGQEPGRGGQGQCWALGDACSLLGDLSRVQQLPQVCCLAAHAGVMP